MNKLQLSLVLIWISMGFNLIYFTCGQYYPSLLPNHEYQLGQIVFHIYYYSVPEIEYWTVIITSTIVLITMTKIGWKLTW